MTDRETAQAGPLINARLLPGGVLLMGIGGVIGLVGLAVGGSAVLAAGRRGARQMQVPPGELAKMKLAQARAATAAGVGAWRDSQQAPRARSS